MERDLIHEGIGEGVFATCEAGRGERPVEVIAQPTGRDSRKTYARPKACRDVRNPYARTILFAFSGMSWSAPAAAVRSVRSDGSKGSRRSSGSGLSGGVKVHLFDSQGSKVASTGKARGCRAALSDTTERVESRRSP
jgi:hypothetical protein